MIVAALPENEVERLENLRSYSILDTVSEADFDNLVTIASEICNTSISTITLVDQNRQWFKARVGNMPPETSRTESFCAHAIHHPYEIFVVENASEDPRFFDYPNVLGDPKIAFYAGVPLVSEEGHALGTICVIDQEPKKLTEKQEKTLKALARQTMNLLNLKKRTTKLELAQEELLEKNQQLERFALVAAHDIKSPLNVMSGLTDFVHMAYQDKMDEELKEIIGYLQNSSRKLTNMVDGILSFSKSDKMLLQCTNINVGEFYQEMIQLFPDKNDLQFSLDKNTESITSNEIALKQIVLNLFTNAIRYNDKPIIKICLGISDEGSHYQIYVQDNGMGIEQRHFDKIFEIFSKAHSTDRNGDQGNGIGLATVKNLTQRLGGKVSVESEVKTGSRFTLTIPK